MACTGYGLDPGAEGPEKYFSYVLTVINTHEKYFSGPSARGPGLMDRTDMEDSYSTVEI